MHHDSLTVIVILDDSPVMARSTRCRSHRIRRASWLKPDGTEVHYLHFAEQIAAVTAGDTQCICGTRFKDDQLKFSGAIIVKL